MTDVFLSYSSKDADVARGVQLALTAAGYRVFWDQQTPAGMDWDHWIRSKLEESRVVVVLWSKASLASPNVRHEALISRDASKLLPVLIEEVKPSELPMGLYLVQSLKLIGGPDESPDGLARLLSEVRVRLGASTAPPEPVAVPLEAQRRRPLPLAAISGAAVIVLLAVGLGVRAFISDPAPVPPSPGAHASARAGAPVSPLDGPTGNPTTTPAVTPGNPIATASAPHEDHEAPTRSRADALAPAQKLLGAYYDDLRHVETFDASKYFAPNPSHYLLWVNAKSRFTRKDIDRNAPLLASYRPEMLENSLEKSASGTFSYIERSHVTKQGKTKIYTALIAVDLDKDGKISRMQTVPRRPP